VAENILDRQFEPEAKDRAWTADITYIPTREGWLYLAAVEDLHSRQIVGWAMSERIDSRLVVDALEMAVVGRLPGGGWWPTRTGVASMPASTTGECSPSTGSPAA
jgi:putative transposase